MDIVFKYLKGYCVEMKVKLLSVSPHTINRTHECKLFKDIFELNLKSNVLTIKII